MSTEKVIDSWALLCYLQREPGHEEMIDILSEASVRSPLLMCVVNWGEVQYTAIRRLGEAAAVAVEDVVRSLPIEIIDADQDLTREAARLKARVKMSYADCFAAALAVRRKAALYTGDPEFKAVEKDVRIAWLPRKSK